MLVPLTRSLRDFDRLTRHVDTLFDGAPAAATRDGISWRVPVVDVKATETGVAIQVELPGVLPADLSVREERGELVLEGKRAGGTIGFRRTFRLSDELDAEHIEARLELGLLSLAIPRRTGQVRQIKIDS